MKKILHPERFKLASHLPPNVIRLGWVSLLADISSEMLYPVIPIFLTTVIGAPVSVLGLIEGIAESIASLLKTYSGRLSDQKGRRKPFILAGYSLSAFAKPLIGLASGWWLVLFARSLDRIGKGLRTSPRDALLADSVRPELRGMAFGWHRGMDTLGAILGPLISLGLISIFTGHLRWIFFIAWLPGFLGALLVLRLQETLRKPPQPSPDFESPKSLPHAALPPRFRRYLFAWGLFSITNSSDLFILLRAHQLGFSTSKTILLYTFYNITYAIASPLLGQLSDRIGRKAVLVSGLLIFALVYSGLAIVTQSWQLWPLFGIYGLYIAATDGVGKAYAVDLVAPEFRGTAIGLLGTTTGLATLVASSVAGLLWTYSGSPSTFFYGAAGAALSAAILGLSGRSELPSKI